MKRVVRHPFDANQDMFRMAQEALQGNIDEAI
jgi:hypothetical protein